MMGRLKKGFFLNHRHYTVIDRLCLQVDQALRGTRGSSSLSHRPYPAEKLSDHALSTEERQQVGALMRINHAGEVCAQALYHGQALVSRDPTIREKLHHSAIEENDHLNWCQQRLNELHSHPSYLNPLWYSASFMIGVLAGVWGDEWSLAFLAETETQVVNHLEKHLDLLPNNDQKSKAILQQMQKDEAHHRDEALHLGAATLPDWIKQGMRWVSKIMVTTARWI